MKNNYVLLITCIFSVIAGCLGADAAKDMMGVGSAGAQSSCSNWKIAEVDSPANVNQQTVSVPKGWEPFAALTNFKVLIRSCDD